MPAPAAPVGHSPGDRLRRLWADRLDPNSYLGFHLTVSLVGIALSVWVFGALLDAVLDNDLVVRWDIAVDLAIHRHMTPPSLRAVDVVTQLGSPVTMVLLGLGVAIVLWRRGQRTVCWGWLAAFGGGAALDEVFKLLVHRSRPVYGAAYLHGLTYSFPSGHSTGSLIGYGMIVYLVRHVWHARPLARRLAGAAAVLIIVAIGASRVLLGVHYPSDVIGGWAIGLAWMGVCVTGIGIAQHRHMDRSQLAGAGASGHPAP